MHHPFPWDSAGDHESYRPSGDFPGLHFSAFKLLFRSHEGYLPIKNCFNYPQRFFCSCDPAQSGVTQKNKKKTAKQKLSAYRGFCAQRFYLKKSKFFRKRVFVFCKFYFVILPTRSGNCILIFTPLESSLKVLSNCVFLKLLI